MQKINGQTYRQDETGQWFVWTNEGTLLNCWGWLACEHPKEQMIVSEGRAFRTATTRERSYNGARRLVRRVVRAGGNATIHRKNRGESTWDITYVLPKSVRASDVGISFDVVPLEG